MSDRRHMLDGGTRRFVEGCGVALLVAAFVAGVLLLVGSLQAQTLPASVQVTNHRYVGGPQVIDCWLDGWQYAALPGGGYALIVTCHDDIGGIFRDGFEA